MFANTNFLRLSCSPSRIALFSLSIFSHCKWIKRPIYWRTLNIKERYNWEQLVHSLMAAHSSVLAWRIPGMGDPGGLASMGSQSWTQLKWLSSSSSSSRYFREELKQSLWGKACPGKTLLTKTDAHLESWQVKFSLGQNEDCSPGGSTSDSSERQLQRGSWGR